MRKQWQVVKLKLKINLQIQINSVKICNFGVVFFAYFSDSPLMSSAALCTAATLHLSQILQILDNLTRVNLRLISLSRMDIFENMRDKLLIKSN